MYAIQYVKPCQREDLKILDFKLRQQNSVFVSASCLFFVYVLSDIAGGILKPTLAGSNQPSGQQPEKLVSDDLDSSLANLVGSKCDTLLSAALIKARVHYNICGQTTNTLPRMNFSLFRPRHRERHDEKVSDGSALCGSHAATLL